MNELEHCLEEVRKRKSSNDEIPRDAGAEVETPRRQLRRLERALVDSNVAEAQEEAAAELSSRRLQHAATRLAAKESELSRLRACLDTLTAEAEEVLQANLEYRKVAKEAERVRRDIAEKEQHMKVLEQDSADLTRAICKVTEEMALNGHPQAVALSAARQAEHGKLSLRSLKEHVASVLSKHQANVTEAQVNQQVLEAIYSLVSASLIFIDRASPQQIVTVNLSA